MKTAQSNINLIFCGAFILLIINYWWGVFWLLFAGIMQSVEWYVNKLIRDQDELIKQRKESIDKCEQALDKAIRNLERIKKKQGKK